MNDKSSNPPARSDRGAPAHEPARVHPVDWALGVGAGDELWRATAAKVRRKRHRRLALAGTAAALALAAIVGWRMNHGEPTIETAAGTSVASTTVLLFPERRMLPDGSVVELKPGAAVEVAYAPGVRRIMLARGEAHFSVAKDPQRPFVVQVGGIDVRAVGTAFSVEVAAERIEVVVTEGIVAVDRQTDNALTRPGSTSGAPLALAEAGKRVIVERPEAPTATAGVDVVAIAPTEVQERLAWRVRRVEFTRTPLADVIEIMNRHGNARLVLGDASLGQVHLSGIMRVDNTDTLLRLLEEEHGVRVAQRGSDVVLQRAR